MSTKKALLVGVGGLGCPTSLALAQAGVAHLTLVDPDVVESSNLHRQPWYRSRDVGRPKVEVAAARLRAAFPALEIAAIRARVDEGNVAAFLTAHDVSLDGTDDVHAKFLLSDAASRAGALLVYGGVLRFAGQAMVIAPGGPCLRCLFEEPQPGEEAPSCARAGVLGTMAGVVGGIQASMAVSLLLGRPARGGRLVVVDGWTMASRARNIRRAPDCIACGAERPAQAAREGRGLFF